MSCVRKLFKRKFLRTQSSETILVAQQSENNSPSDPVSSSTAVSADHDDASSACSDGNVTSDSKAAAPDQPNPSTAAHTTTAAAVVVTSSQGAASTSALLIPPERRRPHGSVGLQPPSSPLSITSGKRPSSVSDTPAPVTTIPDLTTISETKKSVPSASFKLVLPAVATRGGRPSRGFLRLQQKEFTVADMEGRDSKVRLEGQPSSPSPSQSPTSSSPLESVSHSKGVLTSAYLSPRLIPAATESKVLTTIISSQNPGYSFDVAARLGRSSPVVSSSLSQGASASTGELQAEDGGRRSSLPQSSAPEVSFLTDSPRISEPSLLSDLPQTTPPGAWGEELDVEAPPIPEAFDRGYPPSYTESETHSAPYPQISPVLASFVHPVYDASISDDVILPDDLFFECSDSGETPEAPGMERPRNPTPYGSRRLMTYPECSVTPPNQFVDVSEATVPPARFRDNDASTKTKGKSKEVFKEAAKEAQKGEVTIERVEDEKHLKGRQQQEEVNDGEKAMEEEEEDEVEEEERRVNEEEENVPEHLMDVFELGKMCSRSRAKLNSADQRLSRRQKKIFILQQQVMQQAEELKELTRLIRMAEAQTNALKEEKKELDAELQKTCDQLTDVDEVNTKKHEPLMYKKFSTIKTAAEAKTLLVSIRSRQKALYYLEAMTYRKCVALQHNLKLQVSGSTTGSDKDRKLSKRMSTIGPASPKKSKKLKDQLSLSSAAMPSSAVLPALPLMLSAVSAASINGPGLGPLFFPVQETQQQQQQQQPLQPVASHSSSLGNAVLLFDDFRETEV